MAISNALSEIRLKSRLGWIRKFAAILAVQIFVSGMAYGWTVTKDFNDGSVGVKAEGPDGFNSAAGDSLYSIDQSREGGQAVELNIEQGDEAFGSWGGIVDFPSALNMGDEVWVSLEMYVPSGFQFNTDNGYLKFIRLRQTKSDGSHTGYLDNLIVVPSNKTTVFALLKEGITDLHHYGTAGVDDIPFDKWFRFELYVRFGNVSENSGGNAVARAWKDGKLLVEDTGMITMGASGDSVLSLYLFTYWNNGAPRTQSLYLDHIVITNEEPPNRDIHGNAMIGNIVDPTHPQPPEVTGAK